MFSTILGQPVKITKIVLHYHLLSKQIWGLIIIKIIIIGFTKIILD